MDEYLEIDLHEIVKKVLAKWYWVIISGFVVGLIVFLFSYFQTDIFRVTTKFILTEPLYDVSFEDQYQTTDLDKPSEEVLRTIVLNDEIVSALYEMWESDSKETTTLREFISGHLSVDIGEKGTLISLIVETDSREQSTLIANTWVDLAIDAVNNIYYGFETDQVGSLESQMEVAQMGVDEAGQRLIDFTTSDPSVVLMSDLNNLLARLDENDKAVRIINAAREDANTLVDVLLAEPSDSLVDPDYRLNFTLIQIKVLNAPNTDGSPYEIVIDSTNMGSDISTGEFITKVETWSSVMADRLIALEEANADLSNEIISLQTEIQELENERSLLQMDYLRQTGIYDILATKYEEVRLTVPSGTSGYVNLIGKASLPEAEDRLPHNTIRNTLIAAVAGGVVAIAVIFICDWWNCAGKTEQKDEE